MKRMWSFCTHGFCAAIELRTATDYQDSDAADDDHAKLALGLYVYIHM